MFRYDLTDEEKQELDTHFKIVLETSLTHLAYCEDIKKLTDEDEGLRILEEAFIYLFNFYMRHRDIYTATTSTKELH